MKVLMKIPKSEPPQLEGDYFSRAFKEFVSLCLQKDPRMRWSAKDLLKHRFIKTAKKATYLTELILRKESWLVQEGESESEMASEPGTIM